MSSETPSPSASPHSSDGECSPPSAANNGKPKKCRFNDCDNLAVDGTSKCAFHKNRRQCCVENCTNQVYARKLCVRHGGKKQCQADNCEAHARGGGFCLQHGGFVVKRSYLSLGLFPTPKLADRTPGGHEEDLDAIINSYSKFMGPDTPMAFHHPNIPGQFGASPMLENINANVFDHANHMNNNRNPIAAMAAAAAVHNTGAQRLKMDFLSPRGLAAHNFESAGYPTTTTTSEGLSSTATLSGSSDYAAQFFADNKNDKTRGAMKSSAVSAATTPTHKPTGVTAA
ncbi:hypothetical protein BBJ29_009001 [Phytophthora kernoviae]|uniref:Uncharacterized protein n=1 Tax=Phytophthora kernoviae TaxID=325452 RepID=A0A421FQ02_9STRA|nr:hypothetical protein BBJ29_009001 [Phytophthora kernoviae]